MNAREYQAAIVNNSNIKNAFQDLTDWRHALTGDHDIALLMGMSILVVLYFAEKYKTYVSFEEANLAAKNSHHRTAQGMLSILLLHVGRLLSEEPFDLEEEERHESFQRILNSLFALIAKQGEDPIKLLENTWQELA